MSDSIKTLPTISRAEFEQRVLNAAGPIWAKRFVSYTRVNKWLWRADTEVQVKTPVADADLTAEHLAASYSAINISLFLTLFEGKHNCWRIVTHNDGVNASWDRKGTSVTQALNMVESQRESAQRIAALAKR